MKTKAYVISAIIILALVIFSAIMLFIPKNLTNNNFSLEQLKLDQEETYISLSSNSAEGYDRWIPFYFTIQTSDEYSETKVEELLDDAITETIIYTESKQQLFRTSELIWSAYQVKDSLFNLTLVVVPDFNELVIGDITKVSEISFLVDGQELKYSLSDYYLESRETIKQKDVYITLSTIETTLNDGIAEVNYGIMDDAKSITKFELEFPEKFAAISQYYISEIEYLDEGITKYYVNLFFSDYRKKVVFRPFLKISYMGEEGFIIPSLPAYIDSV